MAESRNNISLCAQKPPMTRFRCWT